MQETNSLQQTPVKFRFKNIGPVTDAELELGDLTLIAGRNNTGKTYIVYTLYGFLKMWRGWSLAGNALANEKYSDAAFPDIKKIAQELSQEGRASFPLNRTTLAKQRKIMIGNLPFTSQRMLYPTCSAPNQAILKTPHLKLLPPLPTPLPTLLVKHFGTK